MLTLGGKPLQVPILQGGMGVGVSLGGLAGAVAACGGRGRISTADAGYREPDFARDPAAANHRALTAEIQKAKAIAGGMGLVAINAMVATRDYADAIRTAVAAGVDAVVSGAGLPLELPGIVGTKEVAIAPIVSSARAAKLILRRWAKGFDRTADFVALAGKKYHKKRNHIAQFSKYGAVFSEITPNDFDECITFAAESYNAKDGYSDASSVAEQYAIHTFFQNFEALELKGGLLRVDGELAAFSIGEPICSNTFGVHIEKADTRFHGAYPAMAQAFAAHFAMDYTYLNR